MDTNPVCPTCGKPVFPGSPQGLCPECLIKSGFETNAGNDPAGAKPIYVPPSVEEIAKLLPQLEVLDLLGQGGMGAVYKARQKELDRIVALKILPPDIGRDPAFAERFAREAKALAKLNHPGIVTIYDFGQVKGIYFFLMEFVDGMNLRQLLARGRVSPREALAIVPQICDALQYAHDQGIVHRDIKPENILLDRRGRVKVADFGLAKLVGSATEPMAGGENAGGEPALTESGKIMGTPNYMAPEQMKRPADVDNRADIYALGVVFYQMLTGELPGKPIEPPSKKVQIDVRLDEVVLRALENEPDLRFQQANALKTQVETIVQTPPSASPALADASSASPVPGHGYPPVIPPAAASMAPTTSHRSFGIALGIITVIICVTLGVLTAIAVRKHLKVKRAIAYDTVPTASLYPKGLFERPKLRFLAWEDEWDTNHITTVWYPNGSRVTNITELLWVQRTPPPSFVFPVTGRSFLRLWFSDPGLHEGNFSQISLFDDSGKPLKLGADGNVESYSEDASQNNGDINWLSWMFCPGESADSSGCINLRLRYTGSPLEHTQEVQALPKNPVGTVLEGKSHISGFGQNAEGHAFLSISLYGKKMKARLFYVEAVTHGGHRLSGRENYNGSEAIDQFEFDAPVADIAKFVVGSRPVRTVVFKRVKLPGGATPEDIQFILTNGLVAYYPFHGNANDESGNGHDGILAGDATFGVDRFGRSNACLALPTLEAASESDLAFSDSKSEYEGPVPAADATRGMSQIVVDKSHAYSTACRSTESGVDIPSLSNMPYSPVTYSVWFWLNGYAPVPPSSCAPMVLVGREQCEDLHDGAICVYSEGGTGTTNQLIYYTGMTAYATKLVPPINRWCQVVFTVDESGNANFYFNGTNVPGHGSAPDGQPLAFRIGASVAGGCDWGPRYEWNGRIDDVRIYNRALSASEVSELYQYETVCHGPSQFEVSVPVHHAPKKTNPQPIPRITVAPFRDKAQNATNETIDPDEAN